MSDIWGNAKSSNKAAPPSDTFGQIAYNITSIASSLRELQQLVDDIGSSKDGRALRNKMSSKREETQLLVNQTKAALQKPFEPTDKAKHSKLAKNFNDVLIDYEKMIKASLIKEREIQSFIEERRSTNINTEKGEEKISQFSELREIEEEFIIEAQNNDMKSIEADLEQLTQIFVDLSEEVEKGGEILGQAEDNSDTATAQVKGGSSQLKKATELVKSARVKVAIITALVLLLAFIICIAVWLGVCHGPRCGG